MSDRSEATPPSSRRTSASHWFYLVYLANLGWQPFFDPALDWLEITANVAVLLTVPPLWGRVPHEHGDRLRRVVVALVVIGFLGTIVNVGASVVFVFAAAAAAGLGDDEALRAHIGMTVLLVVLMAVGLVPLPFRIWGVVPSLLFVWVVGISSRRDVANVAEAERLRVDNVRIEALATAAERDRISQDLHDLLGQSLTGLVVRAQLINRLAPLDPAAAAEEASRLEASARTALQQVRDAVSGLAALSLEEEVGEARRVLAAAGVDARVVITTDERPGALVERSLALALREAVTNVVRHAHAARCSIEVTGDADGWTLLVRDDGLGGDHVEGSGLRGMRERIAAVGGSVERWSQGGTALRVTVPT